jgi:ATP-dependent DNA helicase DinG
VYCHNCRISDPAIEDQSAFCEMCGTQLQAESQDLLGDTPTRFTKEIRAPQLLMAEVVENSFRTKQNAIIEAGVGTGKSFAYAIPAIASGKRTVISTATINLQSQLMRKDLPILKDELAKFGHKCEFAVVKGKSHYVCGLAVENAAKDKKQARELSQEFRQWASKAKAGGISGDKAELGNNIPSNWEMLTAEDCVGKSCKHHKTCGYIKAKEAVRSANVVVANHAIVGFDIALSSEANPNPILKEYDFLILDEAHKALTYFRNAFSKSTNTKSLTRACKAAIDRNLNTFDISSYNDAQGSLKDLFAVLPNPYSQPFILVSSSNANSQLTAKCTDAIDALHKLDSPMTRTLNAFLTSAGEGKSLTSDDWREVQVLKRTTRRIATITDTLQQLSSCITQQQSPNAGDRDVVFVKNTPHSGKVLSVMPVDIGPILAAKLYPTLDSAILTSGTLRINEQFNHIINSFGVSVPEDKRVAVKSPFDYDNNAVLFLPKNMPPPPKYGAQKELTTYANTIADHVDSMACITSGRVLVLFTARTELNAAYDAATNKYPKWKYFKQNQDQRPEVTLERYRQASQRGDSTILFGLKSYFEGISLEGDDLLCVVLVKLPFPIMADPVYQTQCEQEGKKSFFNITLPEMIKDVQQAAGRLIRTSNDVGIVAILDNRIHTKSYGETVIRSLPFSQRTSDISKVQNWFNKVKQQRKQL